MSNGYSATEFRNIDGWNGYCVSKNGVVKSCRKKGRGDSLGSEWKVMNQAMDDKGYFVVSLYDGRCGKKVVKVHRLGAAAFLGSCPDGMFVCHCNGIRTDNRAENLRYDTPQGNSNDCVKHGNSRPGIKCNMSKLTDDKVTSILADYATEKFVLRELAEKYSVGITAIHRIVIRKTWRHVPVPYLLGIKDTL